MSEQVEPTEQIELRAVEDYYGNTAWCAFDDADMLSIYVGTPGNMGWMADFALGYRNEAIRFCTDYAAENGVTFHDRIGEL